MGDCGVMAALHGPTGRPRACNGARPTIHGPVIAMTVYGQARAFHPSVRPRPRAARPFMVLSMP
jgi:hypothetical protein